jgi:hypothetical protein
MVDHVQNIQECFTADFNTGQVFYAKRPRSHFSSDGFWQRSLRDKAGRLAPTTTMNKGHLQVSVAIRGTPMKYLVHRIVWALAHGEYPRADIDHIDNNPANNALSNLRLATRSQNTRNAVRRAPGLKGTSLKDGKWYAQVWDGTQSALFGPYETADQAHARWVAENVKLAGEFFNAGYPSIFD